jgi:Ca2+-binding RTX toxin-like protein
MRNVAGTDASILANGTSGADVILTTGFNGAVILDTPSSVGVDPLEANSGNIVINADRMLIAATTSVRADAGQVTLRPATEGRTVLLGNAGDAALALELSDTELDRIFASSLVIGGIEAGLVRVVAPISPGGAQDVTIRGGSDVSIESDVSIIDGLTLRAGGDLRQFAATTILVSGASGGALAAFVDDVGDDGGIGGTNVFAGTVTTSSMTLTGNLDQDVLNGLVGDDTLFGLGGKDTLNGFGGNDELDGGTGNDTMSGGLGDDTYFVDSAGDLLFEAAGEGSDTVIATASYTLSGGREIELLRTLGSATSYAVDLTGNAFVQTLVGNAAVNVLDGKAGADTMLGHAGNDTYFVDNAGDTVIEAAGEGTDTVISAIDYTLAAGEEIEVLRTFGSGTTDPLDFTGNEFANTLVGNAAINILDGKAGADTLQGFAGNDTYFIDNAGDALIEAIGGGYDTAISNVSYTIAAGQAVELLRTPGSGTVTSLNFTGNELANTLVGNAGTNFLNGKDGLDTLHGFAGTDTFRFNTALGPGNIDAIADFVAADDTIQLENGIFAGLAAGALPASAFVIGASAADASDRIVYNGATGQLFFDPDGTGAAAQVHFATLTGAPVISASDFFVI